MIENVLKSLSASTPALRQRYLARIRTVNAAEAREIQARLESMVERDREVRAA